MQTLVNEGYLSIGDMRLEYQLIDGKPVGAPMIIMLHEGLGSARTWGEFHRLLSEATGASALAY